MIFMLDDKEILIEVNLFVKDQEGLFMFLNQLTDSSYLGEDGNYDIVSSSKKNSFGSLVYFGNYKKDNLLIKNYQVSFGTEEYFGKELEWLFEYKQDVIKCMNLNSVLLFFNLLDESSSYLMDELAVDFLRVGIFNRQSLDVVWKTFISSLENNDSERDLNNFIYALENNLIGISIKNSWTKKEMQEEGLLKKFNIDINDLMINTQLFNKSNYLVKKRSK